MKNPERSLAHQSHIPRRRRSVPWVYLVAFGFCLMSGALHADILYVVDHGNNSLDKITSNGTVSTFANSGLNVPYGVAFDPAGSLYVSNDYLSTSGGNNYYIEKYTPNGVGSVFANNLSSPTGLAFDNAGNLYVANVNFATTSISSSIIKITPSGMISTFATTGLNQPQGLAFDKAGNLYVANRGNNTIEEFTLAGTATTFASSGLDQPYGLAFDQAGNLFASNTGSFTIMKFNQAGASTQFAAQSGVAGLAFDSAGNLYAANTGNNENGGATIVKFAPNGTASTFATGLTAPLNLAFTTDSGTPLLGVPEPTAWMLVVGGLSGLGVCQMRCRATNRRCL